MKPTPEEEKGMELFGQNLFMAAKDAEVGEEWEIVTSTGTVYSYKGTRGNAEAYARAYDGVLRRKVKHDIEE